MTRSVDAVRPVQSSGEERMEVSLTLDCGCSVDRTVHASRLLEVEDLDGNRSYFIAGKFLCDRHSHEPN
jgi:hypothetical protein